MQTFFTELAEHMFNIVYENYPMLIKITKYKKKLTLLN